MMLIRLSDACRTSGRSPRSLATGLALAGLLAAGLLAVGGCASGLTAQVTSFHRLDAAGAVPGDTPADRAAAPPLTGRSFAIRPSSAQRGGLEFDRYAGLVRDALVAKGLVDRGRVADGEAPPAELAVDLRYGATSTGGAGTFGSAGTRGGVSIGSGRGGGVSFGLGIGLGFPFGGGPVDRGPYRHELQVTIDRIGAVDQPRVFEGRATTESTSGSLASVMPALVRALFLDFPGASGVSRVVTVPLDDPPGGR